MTRKRMLLLFATMVVTTFAFVLPTGAREIVPRNQDPESLGPGGCGTTWACSNGCCVLCFPMTSPNGGCAHTCVPQGC